MSENLYSNENNGDLPDPALTLARCSRQYPNLLIWWVVDFDFFNLIITSWFLKSGISVNFVKRIYLLNLSIYGIFAPKPKCHLLLL